MKAPNADAIVSLCRLSLYVWICLVLAIILVSRLWASFL